MVRLAVSPVRAAAAWSCVYAVLGVHWTFGGDGFPFGAGHDPGAHLSVLGDAPPAIVAPLVALLGFLGMMTATAMARGIAGRRTRSAVLAFAWTLALGLTVVIPDFRILVVVAYAPILLAGAPFGWPPGVRFFEAIPWPLINQAMCMTGGVLWGCAAVAYQRLTRHGGGIFATGRWMSLLTSRRVSSIAVGMSVAIPVLYAITRWTWALGYPLGISEAFFRDGQAVGLWWMGGALGTLAIIAAVLAPGLIRLWGERFPRWLPRVAGRRVPPLLVVVPASMASLLITSAGLMFVRLTISGTLRIGDHAITLTENWGALAPELLWPIWGFSLGVATLGYWERSHESSVQQPSVSSMCPQA